MENNVNISKFAAELTELTGQHIGLDHIYPSTEGRYYYIQAPKSGAPMLLHHYRGPFFIDIHPDDFEDISSGKVSAHEYITSANWQVGYYWGGGSMVGGGYYQPLDLVGRRDEVRRYLEILACRGYFRSSGYMPTADYCAKCAVEKCPFSPYKGNQGNWENEIQEPDARVDFFKALRERFEKENPGFTLRGFLSDPTVPNGEIWLRANGKYEVDEKFSFTAYASNGLVQAMLMREDLPELFVQKLIFRIYSMTEKSTFDVNTQTLEKAFEGLDYTQKEEEEVVAVRVVSLLEKVKNFFFRK